MFQKPTAITKKTGKSLGACLSDPLITLETFSIPSAAVFLPLVFEEGAEVAVAEVATNFQEAAAAYITSSRASSPTSLRIGK